MRRPSLYTVLVDPDPGDGRLDSIHCGFQQTRRSWFGYRLLDVCMVRVGDGPDTAVVTSQGTYRRHQFLQLASIKEWDFPPRALDLEDLAIEPAEVRRRFERHVWPENPAERRPLGLGLRIYEGSLAWQGVVDVPEVGVHTLIVAARDGRVLFHKFDQYGESRDTNVSPPRE